MQKSLLRPFSPTSRLLPVLVAQPPARPYKAGIAHRCSLVSLRAEGLPSLVIEPPDSLMGLLAPKTPSEPKNNSPPAGAWKFFLGASCASLQGPPRLFRPTLLRNVFKWWQQSSRVAPREKQSFADFLLPKYPSMVHKPPPYRAVLKIANLHDFSVLIGGYDLPIRGTPRPAVVLDQIKPFHAFIPCKNVNRKPIVIIYFHRLRRKYKLAIKPQSISTSRDMTAELFLNTSDLETNSPLQTPAQP